MSQAGYVPIQLYYSTSTGTVPLQANLSSGELAINIADGVLFYLDNLGNVQVLARRTTTAGVFTTMSANSASISSLTLGGAVTAGGASGVGTSGQVLTSSGPGLAPQWTTFTPSGSATITGGTIDNTPIGTTTPSTASFTSLTLAGTTSPMLLGTSAGTSGQVLTSQGPGATPIWATATGGSGSPGGSSGQIQYNNAGSFGGVTSVTIVSNVLTTSNDITLNGMRAGRGASSVATNTAFGTNTLDAVTTGSHTTAIGYQAGQSTTTAADNTYVGYLAGKNTTGAANTLIGAGTNVSSGNNNIAIGISANAGAGSNNIIIGPGAGNFLSSGGANVIIGGYDGGSGGPIANTGSNFIVFADGAGSIRSYWDNTNSRWNMTAGILIGGALFTNTTTPSAGTSGQVLTSAGAGAPPTWTTVSTGGTVAITGGTIDGTTIGATTPSSGNFTNLQVTTSAQFTGSARFNGPLNFNGATAVQGTLMVSGGASSGSPNWLAQGTSGQVLTSAGAGANPTWTTPSSGGGTPGGSTGQFQYNNAGALGGTTGLEWNGTQLNSTTNIIANSTSFGRGGSADTGTTAGGTGALASASTGGNNTAFGWNALNAMNGGSDNVAVGRAAGNNVTSGARNVAVGSISLGGSIGAGNDNVAIGYKAMSAVSAVSSTTAIGSNSIGGSGGYSGGFTVCVGTNTGAALTTGLNHVLIGANAGQTMTTSNNNVAIGYNSQQVATGNANTSVGMTSLGAVTSDNNTAVGYLAGKVLTSGGNNTLLGQSSGFSLTTGANNTLVGNTAGSNVTGSNNVFLGNGSGSAVTTGGSNVIIGGYSGNVGPISASGNGHIVFSDGVGNVRGYWDNVNSRWVLNGGLSVSDSILLAGIPGTSGQVLTSQGAGASPSWTTPTGGGGGTPGGSNTQLQYNASGVFGGISGVTTNGTTISTTVDITVNGVTVGKGTGTGTNNTCIGPGAGSALTTGSKNTLIGGYTGSSGPINGTGISYIVLSDGDGNVRLYYDAPNSRWNMGGALLLQGALFTNGGSPSAGSSGQVLTSAGSGSPPTWTTPASGVGTGTVNNFTKAQSVTPVALTYASSLATDASLSNTFYTTLTGNATLANPTNLSDGEVITWYFTQDGTGSRLLTFGSMFKWVQGITGQLSTAPGAVDMITGQYMANVGGGIISCNIGRGVS